MENFNYITITIKDSINMYNNERLLLEHMILDILCNGFSCSKANNSCIARFNVELKEDI